MHMLLYLNYEEMIEREHMSKSNSEAIIFIDKNVFSKTGCVQTEDRRPKTEKC